MFEACGSFQWVREFLKNAMEAGATRVEFGIDWEAVCAEQVYRRTISDDGCGMSAEELLRFFSTLGAGGKKIGGVHDNFGVGAKIAALPWNPEGVVVLSYRDGVGSMIWIVLDEETGEYELVEFDVGRETRCVIKPGEIDGIHWDCVAPDWVRDHGTTIVLLGSEEAPHTMLGNPHAGEADIKGLSKYLNSRFRDLDAVKVTVAELRSSSDDSWPLGPDDKHDARRINNRSIEGARHYIDGVQTSKGKPASDGVVPLCQGRVKAEWHLWEGERPQVHTYARQNGYIAVRYKGELFHLTQHKAHFRWFGIVESAVQRNLTLILEPQHFDADGDRWGVHPDQSRSRLIFTDEGEKGAELPLSDWGLEFAGNMPEAIREAIRTARGDLEGSIDDAEYRRRLRNRFGDRWRIKKPIATGKGQAIGDAIDEEEDVAESPENGIDTDHTSGTRKKRRRARRKVRKVAKPGVSGEGSERSSLLDIPKYRLARADDFERDWHLALWAPNDPAGPTVYINVDSPILQEIVEYHQARYPDVFAEEVAKAIRQVFGEVAVAKIAHSQKLARMVASEVLDSEYRNEHALTTALMGLVAEESLIVRRLASLGRSKTATAA